MTIDDFINNFLLNMTYDDYENFDREKAKYAINVAIALNRNMFDKYTVDDVLDGIEDKIYKMIGR